MGFMDDLKQGIQETKSELESTKKAVQPYKEAVMPSQKYVVLQVTLKEKLIGTGSGNLTELEKVINNQANKGYRLHTITTASADSSGMFGGDRIQATMVFERID